LTRFDADVAINFLPLSALVHMFKIVGIEQYICTSYI